MSELETKNPGDILRSTREQQGLSINDVSLATKINPRILKALEEGNFDALPPKSFTRGFIRSYSNYLKINADPIVEAFNMTDTVVVPNPGEGATAPTTARSSAQGVTNFSRSLLVSGIVVLIVMIFGIKQVIEKYSQEGIIEEPQAVESIKADAIETKNVTEETKPAAATEGAASPSTENEVTTNVAKDSNLKDTSAISPAEAAPKPTQETTAATATGTSQTTAPAATTTQAAAPAKVETETKLAPKAETEVKSAETKPAEKKVAPLVAQELLVEALDKVELIIKTEEGTKKIQLAPESVHTIKTRGNITLEISDGGTVNLVHNGRDKGIPGDLGKPKTVTFP